MSCLTVVRAPTEAPESLLILGKSGPLRAEFVEQTVICPRISMLLWEHYELGRMMDAGGHLGMQMEASIYYVWRGQRRRLTGAAVPLMGGPLLVVPIGFFRRH